MGLVFTAAGGYFAFEILRHVGVRDWFVDIVSLLMVWACGSGLQFAVFGARGLLGRPALILDADGLTDQSTPSPLGRVLWDEVEAIHWATLTTNYATLPLISVDRRNGQESRWKVFRARGINPSNLDITDEELAHLFRRYSGGRFGIAQQ